MINDISGLVFPALELPTGSPNSPLRCKPLNTLENATDGLRLQYRLRIISFRTVFGVTSRPEAETRVVTKS